MKDQNPGLNEAREVLQRLFGYSAFKPAQEQVISAALAGDDVLAVLQTGYGKSVCFQIPAMLRTGCAIVVSPLIALMKDQVDNAQQRGIPASFVNSSLDPEETTDRINAFASGEYRLFYVAPERLSSRPFREALERATISFIVVDEAHCASMWGHDFRPAFARIHEIGSIIWSATQSRPPIIAVTATATADIEDDIATSLGMSEEYVRIVGDPIRPNLTYERPAASYSSDWTVFMREIKPRLSIPGKHLAYATTRGGAEKLAEMICQDFGRNFAQVYHGGMDREERVRVQDAFTSGTCRVVCATNAFGMGIDVPDIRTVVHFGIPGSIESYVQETGRAGRDGKESTVILVPSDYSVDLNRRFIENANPPIGFYSKFWKWLVSETSGGLTIKKPANVIADECGRSLHIDISGEQVTTILNVLEGHGLVRREYYTGGTPVMVFMTEIAAFCSERASDMKGSSRVARLLYARALDEFTSGEQRELCIDKSEAALELGMSESTVTTALKSLTLTGAIRAGRIFTGKTTTVRRADIVLDDVLPVERLTKKRARDLARFQSMLDYSHLGDPQTRKTFIRDYFLGKEDGVSRAKPSV